MSPTKQELTIIKTKKIEIKKHLNEVKKKLGKQVMQVYCPYLYIDSISIHTHTVELIPQLKTLKSHYHRQN